MSKLGKRSASFIDDSNSDAEAVAPSKAPKKAKTTAPAVGDGKDADGQPYWELPGKRRAGLSKFGGKLLVSIREYYEKDGEVKPGKKGISLNIEQYQALVKVLPGLNAALREAGHAIEEPTSASASSPTATTSDAEPAQAAKNSSKKEKRKKSKKANIDVTSDEED